MPELWGLLKELSEAVGASGYEEALGRRVAAAFAPFCDEVKFDKLGNCIAVSRGAGAYGGSASSAGSNGSGRTSGADTFSVMLAAHMDEIGFMVTEVEERGFLRLTAMDGVDPRIMPGQEVWVLSASGALLPGVVGAKPPHLTTAEEERGVVPIRDLFVDVGRRLQPGEVRPGDVICLKRTAAGLNGGTFFGKSFDDRAGVVALIHCAELLRPRSHKPDVYFVATVQEELGYRGAVVSTYAVAPDLGVAVDVGHGDTPGVPEHRTVELGKGPAIAVGANVHPSIYDRLVEVARRHRIPFQIEVAPGPTGTDAWAMQITREGVPTGLVSIPLRYMHTSVETLSMGDVELAAVLLCEFICSLDREFVEGLRCAI